MTQRAKILVAIGEDSLSTRVAGALERTGAERVSIAHGETIEQALRSRGPFELVVASAQLGRESTLQSLARARQSGDVTPFLVLGQSQGETLRVFVSDGEGVVLSSRILNTENLARLASVYVSARR